MNILLADPPGNLMGANIGLAYLAAAAREAAHKVALLDLNHFRHSIPEIFLKEAVDRCRPDLVGFSVLTLSYPGTARLLASLRDYYRGTIVLGGAHVSVERGSLLEKHPEVDYLVAGEGEKTLLSLLEHLAGEKTLSEIPGLIYRDNGRIKENPPELINDLDSLPFPDYRILGVERMETYPLLTSRGCPYHCTFCLAAVLSGRKWRPRAVEPLLEELHHALRLYQIDSFTIMDDCFTLDVNRAEEFCDQLIASGLDLPWQCSNGIRADRVNENLVKKMKEAGCQRVFLGVESLVPEVFAAVKKGEVLQKILDAIKLFKKYGIGVGTFHIIGLPGDTYERSMESYRLSKKLGVNRSVWQLLVPFPGTEVYQWVAQHGRQCAPYDEATSFGTVTFDTPDFPENLRREAFLKLSLRNGLFPTDGRFSNLQNARRLLYWFFRYHPLGAPVHLANLAWKAARFLLLGESRARARVKFNAELAFADFPPAGFPKPA